MSEKVLYSMMLKIKEENEKLRKENELNAFKGIFSMIFCSSMTCLSFRCSLYILYQTDRLPENISLRLCLKCKFSI